MSEMESREAGIDGLLRRSMAAPVPSIPPDFERRFMRELGQSSPDSQVLDRYRRILLICYGLISAVVSAVIMRGNGLNWGAVAAMILGPLAVVATVPRVWRATHATMRHGSR